MVPKKDTSTSWKDIPGLYESGHVARVVQLARESLRADPDRPLVRFYLALALRDLTEYAEAAELLENLTSDSDPVAAGLYQSQLGLLYERWGRLDLAETWYSRATTTYPQDAARFVMFGAFLASRGRHAEAEQVHREAVRCEEGPIDEAWLNLGFVLRATRRYDEAAFCFRQALRLDPNYDEATAALRDVLEVTRSTGP
jgi:tetratricopeptide (TPR) repeat protein